MNMTRKRDAFSMMEIMIVVFIIGLLAAVVGPNLMKLMFKGNVSAAQSTVKSLKAAIVDFKMDVGRFPKTLEELVKDVEGVGIKWQGTYLEGQSEIPEDPWGNPYVYHRGKKDIVFPEKYKNFEIISYGEEGEDEPQSKWIHAGS